MWPSLKFVCNEPQANILLSRPSLRGSTPLDIAYSSLMDNTELALAMREHHLEKIAVYLSRCGLTSNAELTAKGYPDLGWVSANELACRRAQDESTIRMIQYAFLAKNKT